MKRRPGQLLLTDVDAEAAITPEGFDRLARQYLEADIEVWPARAFYPSQVAHPCDRFIVWRFTKWKDQLLHGPELESIFREGRLHQPDIYHRLEEMGFQVVREQDRPTQYEILNGRAVISGRPDGRIVAYRSTKYPKPGLVLEAKSMNGYQWDRIDTVADILHSDSHFTRSYYAQGQLYAFLEDATSGVFVLKSKATGMLKLLPFELDYDYAESILKRIERLQPMIERGVDPDPIPYDRGVCGGCGFRNRCYPARTFGDGVTYLDDPTLASKLTRREQLEAGAREFGRLDDDVKETLKHQGIASAICGDFMIDGKQAKDGSIRYWIRRPGTEQPE